MRRLFDAAAVVLSLAAVSACGAASPTSPEPLTPVVPAQPSLPGSLPGIWTGFLLASDCDFRGCQPARTRPFVLRVTTAGSGFAGSFELPIDQGRWEFVIDLTGTVQGDGSVLFTGALGRDDRTFEVRRLVVRHDPSTGLAGTIDLRRLFAPQANSTATTIEGEIASAWHQPLSSNLSGEWSGVATIRSCSGDCRGSRSVGNDVRLTAALVSSGAALTGQVSVAPLAGCGGGGCWVPISGFGAPNVLFSSPQVVPPSAPDEPKQLESFTGSVDGLGRLHGSFVFTFSDSIAIAPFLISARLECELIWLTRTR